MAAPSALKRSLIFLGILVGVTFVSTIGYWNKQLAYVLHQQTSPTVSVSTATPAKPGEKMEPNTLIIESLGIRAPIVYAQEANEDKFQEALINGVVHYPGTATVGSAGNAYIFGHSSDYIWSKGHYKTVFALLPKIKNNETIIASDPNGNKYTFKVVKSFVVDPNDTSVLDQNTSNKAVLTLQTSYPVGTALKRFVVMANLISS